MERQTVAEAIACLQQRGESTSVGHIRKFLGHGSPRDISKYQKELLREEPVPPREAAAMVCHVIKTEEEVPPAPTPETPPPTLLDQADLCLRDAIASENAARRALDFASQAEWEHCHARLLQAQRDRAHAQGTLAAAPSSSCRASKTGMSAFGSPRGRKARRKTRRGGPSKTPGALLSGRGRTWRI